MKSRTLNITLSNFILYFTTGNPTHTESDGIVPDRDFILNAIAAAIDENRSVHTAVNVVLQSTYWMDIPYKYIEGSNGEGENTLEYMLSGENFNLKLV